MEAPTPCVCGEIVELHDMNSIAGRLTNGGNLVCNDCLCDECNGEGCCDTCVGDGLCPHCSSICGDCKGTGKCEECGGEGYTC